MKKWEKEKPNDSVWWLVEKTEEIDDDDYVFSFDKKKRYHLFADYPDKLSPEERAVFDAEFPVWKEYFEGVYDT
jgi:hypothetical protein